MLFVGLVRASEWEPPEDLPPPRPEATWSVPWRALAWVAAVTALLFLAPVAGQTFGGLAGYAILLLGVALGFWRMECWCARQYWRGLGDYQA